jgi:hypothetical protein
MLHLHCLEDKQNLAALHGVADVHVEFLNGSGNRSLDDGRAARDRSVLFGSGLGGGGEREPSRERPREPERVPGQRPVRVP